MNQIKELETRLRERDDEVTRLKDDNTAKKAECSRMQLDLDDVVRVVML